MNINFASLIGQNRIKEILTRSVLTGRLPHALLFTGQSGTGKEAAAIDLAKILLCDEYQRGNEEKSIPCGECPSCVQSGKLAHPNFLILYPLPKPKSVSSEDSSGIEYTDSQRKEMQSLLEAKQQDPYIPLHVNGGQEILIEHIRALRREFSLTTYSGQWRIVLVSQADRLRIGAANAFLKLLEEPPENVLFILTTTRSSRILPTIRSRCQLLLFSPLSNATLQEELQGRFSISKEKAMLAARLANGSWKLASEWAEGKPEEEMKKAVDLLRILVKGDPGMIEKTIDKLSLASSSDTLRNLLTLLSTWLRDVHRFNSDPENNRELLSLESLQKFAEFCKNRSIEKAVEEIENARIDLERNVQPQLILHRLFNKLQWYLFGRGYSSMVEKMMRT